MTMTTLRMAPMTDTAADYALHCLLHPVCIHMHSAMHDDSYRLAGLYIRVHLNMHGCTAGLCECRDPYCWMACYMYGSCTCTAILLVM
eukprot:SAG25_NODE_1166_length_3715_cov_2.299502_5_plen_88_part_00